MEIKQTDFPSQLRYYRERANYSVNELARAAAIDPSYVSRMERHEREPPRRPIVQALADAMLLNGDERDAFMVSAGYAASYHMALEPGDNALLLDLGHVLTSGHLPQAMHDRIRDTLNALVAQWHQTIDMEAARHASIVAHEPAQDRGHAPSTGLADRTQVLHREPATPSW